jgi:hypothetical protein
MTVQKNLELIVEGAELLKGTIIGIRSLHVIHARSVGLHLTRRTIGRPLRDPPGDSQERCLKMSNQHLVMIRHLSLPYLHLLVPCITVQACWQAL